MLKQISEGQFGCLLWRSFANAQDDQGGVLRMTKGVLRMTGELGQTRRSVMLNEVKYLSAEDPSLRSG